LSPTAWTTPTRRMPATSRCRNSATASAP